MLAEDGSISFVPELFDLLESSLERYAALRGAVSDPLERTLVVTYLLNALCAEARTIAACLESAPILEGLEPHTLLQQCLQVEPTQEQAHREMIIKELERRGWRAAPTPAMRPSACRV